MSGDVLQYGGILVPKRFPRRTRAIKRRALVLATPQCKIQFVDPVARRWLKQFFGRPARAGMLPRKVGRWLSQHGPTGSLLVAKKGNARLYLKRQDSYTRVTRLLLL